MGLDNLAIYTQPELHNAQSSHRAVHIASPDVAAYSVQLVLCISVFQSSITQLSNLGYASGLIWTGRRGGSLFFCTKQTENAIGAASNCAAGHDGPLTLACPTHCLGGHQGQDYMWSFQKVGTKRGDVKLSDRNRKP